MIRKNWILLSSCLLLLAGTAWSQAKLVEKVTKKGNELVIPYEKYVMPNGLTLIIHEDHSDPVVHVDVTYHVGSAREQIGKSGFAHFFEHMMFMGSENAPEKLHDNITIGGGGSNNGTTNRDRTNYYETIPANLLEPILWLEADRMGFFLDAVTQPKFEVQRSTVKNERGQNYDNRPYGLVYENVSKNLYPYGHPYSWTTIGYLQDLDRSDVNDLKNFFLRWYGPNNATLTIGGDVKPAEVVKLVEKYFGSIPAGPKVEPVKVTPVKLDGNRYVSYVDNYARLPRLTITYPTVPDYHKDMAALEALGQILGQGKTSILYQHLTKKQLALQASAYSSLSELAGEFTFDMIPTQGKTLTDLEQLFRTALDSFEKRGVLDEDIAKFKGSIESGVIYGLQSVFGKVSQLAELQTFTGNPNKLGEILKMYNAVTKEDVMRVYNQYIKGKGAVILSTLTKGQEQVIARENNYKIDSSSYNPPDYGYAGLAYKKGKDNFDRKKVPVTAASPVLKAPKFWRKDLPNGAKVIGTENTEIPIVNFSVTIPGGHLAATNDLSKAGLASMFAQMMNEDTKNYTAEQIAIELQKLGSSISISSGIDGITFNVQSLKKNFDKTMALLQERMFNPKFTEDAFSRIKKQSLEGFKLQKAQPGAVANAVFAKVNYGDNHILGISQSGTEATVSTFTLQDIQQYYNNYMTSVDAKVVVVGDVKEQEITPKLAFLNKLPKKKINMASIDPAPKVDKTKVYLVDVPKAAQSEFRIGYATGMKYDPVGDYYKTTLMNYPLGEDFTSRLNQNLRETKGWTYGAGSGFSANKYTGDFRFSSGIRADVTDSALMEVMREFNDYTQKGPTAEEVAFMKTAIAQSEALNYETAGQKAAFIRRILEYNLAANYTEQQNKILKSMTPAQMKAIANQYLRPEKLNILLVGDKARILEGVKKLGYEIVELDADGKRISEKKEF
ncbi:MAG TPA: pitrilysin family protein [Flavisolibacter sp.]|nr:pitrilysin family protein [Flavisolibacter sp.]